METLLKIKCAIICFPFRNWIKMTASLTGLGTFAHQYHDEERTILKQTRRIALRLQFTYLKNTKKNTST